MSDPQTQTTQVCDGISSIFLTCPYSYQSIEITSGSKPNSDLQFNSVYIDYSMVVNYHAVHSDPAMLACTKAKDLWNYFCIVNTQLQIATVVCLFD